MTEKKKSNRPKKYKKKAVKEAENAEPEDFSGRISIPRKFERITRVKELTDQGLNHEEISNILNISKSTVHSDRQHLKEIAVVDLTSMDVAKIRSSLFLDLTNVEENAMEEFENFKIRNPKVAKEYLSLVKETIESKAKMFGVLEIKNPDMVINQQINTTSSTDKLSKTARDKISKIVIDEHEKDVS